MEPPRDEEGRIIMTKEYLKHLCEKEGQYLTPKLNSQLYLNHKGFSKISCLEEYVAVEALWLQFNCIEKIEGLSSIRGLRFLYLHNNLIEKIEGLEGLTELVRIDLSDNHITKIEGLAGLTKLQDLKLENNHLTSAESLKGVLEVSSSLTYFNAAGNKIVESPELIPLLKQLPKMTSLYLKDNPLLETMSYYRKHMIAALPDLCYLDGNAIEPFERLTAEAFVKGGKELELETRKKHYNEQQLAAIKKKEDEREYYKKVEERIKRALTVYKQQYIDEYHALLNRREELIKRLKEGKGNRNRNMLKVIKVEKDVKKMREENEGYFEKEPVPELKYVDLRVEDYLDAINPPEDYMQVQEKMVKELEELKARNDQSIHRPPKEPPTGPVPAEEKISAEKPLEEKPVAEPIPDLETVIDLTQLKPVSVEEFKWTPQAENDLRELTTKHAFDFEAIQKEFVTRYPGANLRVEEVCKKWTEIEAGDYRGAMPQENVKDDPMDQME